METNKFDVGIIKLKIENNMAYDEFDLEQEHSFTGNNRPQMSFSSYKRSPI